MIFEDGSKITIQKEFVTSFTKPVTFQLCDNQGGINAASGKLEFPKGRGILPFFTKRKTITGGGSKIVEMRYAINQRKNAQDEYEYSPQTIFFVKGQLTLDPNKKDHVDLYYILKNHTRNKDSKELEGAPIFFEINPEKISDDKVSKRMARHDAEELILKGWDVNQLREIAFAFGDINAENRTKTQLQDYLSELMDKDPVGFYQKATSEDLVLRANISKGLALKVIAERGGIWYWGNDAEREDKNEAEICRVRSGEDAVTRLLVFFNRATKAENLDYFLAKLKDAEQAEQDLKESKKKPVEVN